MLPLLTHPSPGMCFDAEPAFTTGGFDKAFSIAVRHLAAEPASKSERRTLDECFGPVDGPLGALRRLYDRHNGLRVCELCTPDDAPMQRLLLMHSSEVEAFTLSYRPGGEGESVFTLNSSERVKAMYANPDEWVVFGDGTGGALTAFKSGPNAGRIFVLNVEYHGGIRSTTPLARSADEFVSMVTTEPGKIVTRFGVGYTFVGADGDPYALPVAGYTPEVTARKDFIAAPVYDEEGESFRPFPRVRLTKAR